ncbi:MAG TPA: carboxypeptidase-like regulatory domain-containing protein [Thermoanaerobaculia bacterium]
MQLFLQDGAAHLQILSRSRVIEFRDIGAASDFLRPFLTNPLNISTVERAIGSIGDIAEELARRIVSEGLQIVYCAERRSRSAPGVTAQPAQTTPLQDEQAAQTQPAATPDHFIEVELVDDSGKPVANEAYLIELPDGSQRTGRTDGAGRIRITGIDPGTAKISFPDLDKNAYVPDSGS